MKGVSEKCLGEFIAGAHRVAEKGLVVCGSGNLSWRLNDGLMLVTARNSWMDNLDTDDVALCRIKDAALVEGPEPSKEIGFHAGILQQRAEVEVVLHFQSPCATTLACRQPAIEDFAVIPEIPHYIGAVAEVAFLAPGSRELADAVVAAMLTHELVMLRNHGQVVVGASFELALAKAMYFELACKVILGAGEQVGFMPEEAVAAERRTGQAKLRKKST